MSLHLPSAETFYKTGKRAFHKGTGLTPRQNAYLALAHSQVMECGKRP